MQAILSFIGNIIKALLELIGSFITKQPFLAIIAIASLVAAILALPYFYTPTLEYWYCVKSVAVDAQAQAQYQEQAKRDYIVLSNQYIQNGQDPDLLLPLTTTITATEPITIQFHIRNTGNSAATNIWFSMTMDRIISSGDVLMNNYEFVGNPIGNKSLTLKVDRVVAGEEGIITIVSNDAISPSQIDYVVLRKVEGSIFPDSDYVVVSNRVSIPDIKLTLDQGSGNGKRIAPMCP